MTDIKLNEEQRDFVAAFRAWLQKPNSQYFLLTGWAGTGKTYAAMEALKSVSREIVFSAPTHKALQVLRERAIAADVPGNFHTLAAMLHLRLGYLENGEQQLMPGTRGKAYFTINPGVACLVIDEVSMVDRVLWEHLNIALEKLPDLKVLLLGDPHQLPPPRSSDVPIFSLLLPPGNKASLNVVERNSGAIGQNTEGIVCEIVTKADKFKTWQKGENLKLYTDHGEWSNALVLGFQDSSLSVDATKALAWTNKEVDHLNKLVRHGIAKPQDTGLPLFSPGDILTAKERVVDPTALPERDNNYGQILAPTQLARVVDVRKLVLEYEPAADTGAISAKGYELVLHDDGGFLGFARVASVEEYPRLLDYSKKLKKEVLTAVKAGKRGRSFWGVYYGLLDAFGLVSVGKGFSPNLRPAFAQTIHQSQGSTYETVFLNARDVGGCKAKTLHNKLLYVGASRASTALHVLV